MGENLTEVDQKVVDYWVRVGIITILTLSTMLHFLNLRTFSCYLKVAMTGNKTCISIIEYENEYGELPRFDTGA